MNHLDSFDFLSDTRYQQYRIVEKVTEEYSDIDAPELFELLFATCMTVELSDAAYIILADHYGEIVREMLSKYSHGYYDDAPFFGDILLRVLSGFIISNIDSCGICGYQGGEEIWIYHGENETLSDEEYLISVEDTDEDTYLSEIRYLHCYIIPVNGETLEGLMNNNMIIDLPRDLISDDVLTEDIITLVNKKALQAISFQLVGFGFVIPHNKSLMTYSDEEESDYCFTDDNNDAKKRVFNKNLYGFKALRLPYPILCKEDINQYK